jgi:hypothetical protein
MIELAIMIAATVSAHKGDFDDPFLSKGTLA